MRQSLIVYYLAVTKNILTGRAQSSSSSIADLCLDKKDFFYYLADTLMEHFLVD